jgi:inhibitor of KinA
VTFGECISRTHHLDVVRLFALLRSASHPAIRNLHPAYASLLVTFNPLATSPIELKAYVEHAIGRIGSVVVPPSRTIELPVCYDKSFGPDLDFVASYSKISIDEVIKFHSSADYLVYFLGFSPGFPYLGELPKQLRTPRLPTPRLTVPAGSVAIGGTQTGVYPVASPGGWRIIGRTPAALFQPTNDPPTLLQIHDVVRFKPIVREEFEQLINHQA